MIKVEGLGKKYIISHEKAESYTALRDVISRHAKKLIRKKEQELPAKEEFWALKDVSFEVKKGEAIGIIGKNGAGKSTLLKILSRITEPTHGRIEINGRVASLLEVGTGFHHELTGRENIFLNGAILGMSRAEIRNKFDEIVDFSGVEKFLDTPVKRYSSGMYVRLAFAVAAHLEPEILVVDEVLAVGDAEFQKKCLGKMNEVSQKEGRTVLFVSHNLPTIKQLCSKAILLNKGEIIFYGPSQDTINKYLATNQDTGITNKFEKKQLEKKDVQLIKAEVVNSNGHSCDEFDISDDIYINLTIHCFKKIPNIYGYITVTNSQEEILIETDTMDYLPNSLEHLNTGENKFSLRIKSNVLPYGEYTFYLSFAASFGDGFSVDIPGNILKFSVADHKTVRRHQRTSKTSHLLKWEIRK